MTDTKALVKGSKRRLGIVDLKPRKRGLVVEAPRLIDSDTVVGSDQRFDCQTRIASVFCQAGTSKEDEAGHG